VPARSSSRSGRDGRDVVIVLPAVFYRDYDARHGAVAGEVVRDYGKTVLVHFSELELVAYYNDALEGMETWRDAYRLRRSAAATVRRILKHDIARDVIRRSVERRERS